MGVGSPRDWKLWLVIAKRRRQRRKGRVRLPNGARQTLAAIAFGPKTHAAL